MDINENVVFWLVLWFFNATFNNISVKSWLSILLVNEIRGQGENHLISYVRRLEV
jgi:hypothetical protein